MNSQFSIRQGFLLNFFSVLFNHRYDYVQKKINTMRLSVNVQKHFVGIGIILDFSLTSGEDRKKSFNVAGEILTIALA